jgi:serine/threonine protein kinase
MESKECSDSDSRESSSPAVEQAGGDARADAGVDCGASGASGASGHLSGRSVRSMSDSLAPTMTRTSLDLAGLSIRPGSGLLSRCASEDTESLDYEEHSRSRRRVSSRATTLDETSLSSYFVTKPIDSSRSDGVPKSLEFSTGSPIKQQKHPGQSAVSFSTLSVSPPSVEHAVGGDNTDVLQRASTVHVTVAGLSPVRESFGEEDLDSSYISSATDSVEKSDQEQGCFMFGKVYSELDLVNQCTVEDLEDAAEVIQELDDRSSALSPDVEDDIRAAAASATPGLSEDDIGLSFEQDEPEPSADIKQPSVTSSPEVAVRSTAVAPNAPAASVAPTASAAAEPPPKPVHALKYPFLMPIDHAPIVHDVPNNLSMLEDLPNATLIGVGSNSEIYMIESNGVRVAIKMIKDSCKNKPIAVTEFEIEFETLKRLHHPNIIKIYGAGYKPRRFLVLEFISGLNLNTLLMRNIAKKGVIHRLRRDPTFHFRELLLRAMDIADVCYYLHEVFHKETMIIHRDLKPDNIGFTSEGVLKVFDFGLCTHVKPRSNDTQTYEMSGNTGSRRYMAPEVCLKRPYSERCDVYSFGILLWQMARDRVPFENLTREEFINGVATGQLRPKLHKYWKREFCTLLTDCWAQNPVQRPSFKEILQRLEELLATA